MNIEFLSCSIFFVTSCLSTYIILIYERGPYITELAPCIIRLNNGWLDWLRLNPSKLIPWSNCFRNILSFWIIRDSLFLRFCRILASSLCICWLGVKLKILVQLNAFQRSKHLSLNFAIATSPPLKEQNSLARLARNNIAQSNFWEAYIWWNIYSELLLLLFCSPLKSSVGLQLSGTSVLVSDLSKVATQERSLMEQSRELLSTLAAMHVSTEIQSTRVPFWPCVYL